MTDLYDLADKYASCTGASPDQVTDFLNACLDVGKPPLAQDSSRPQGGSMPYPRRTARDQDDPQPQGGHDPLQIDQNPSDLMYNGNQDPDDPGAEMSPETLADFVRMCKDRLAANDDNGESHNQFMNLLGEMVAQAHQEGQVNGDRRRRGARDNGNGRSTPANGMSSFTGRGSADRKRRAMDSSIRAINQRGFLQRFPEAKNISIRG